MFKKIVPKDDIKEVFSLTAKILKILYFLMIVGIIFFTSIMIREWGILTFLLTLLKLVSPLFFGFALAWLLNPIVIFLEKKRICRKIGIVIIYLGLIFLLYLFINALFPVLYRELIEFIEVIPSMLNSAENFITNFFNRFRYSDLINAKTVQDNIIISVQNYGNNIMRNLPDTILTSITSLFSGIWVILISIVISFYLLFDFDNKKEILYKIIPTGYRLEIKDLLIKMETELRKWVSGTLFVSFLVFVLSTIGFVIIGLSSPVLFGFICGIMDIIPYIGPLIGGTVAVIVGFTDSMTMGFLALAVVIIVQQMENWFIQPLIMSRSVKLKPVTIILGLIIFGHFFGIFGMMVATPSVSLLKVLWLFIIEKYDIFSQKKKEFEKKL